MRAASDRGYTVCTWDMHVTENKEGAHGKAWNHNTGCVAHGWCVPGMSTGM